MILSCIYDKVLYLHYGNIIKTGIPARDSQTSRKTDNSCTDGPKACRQELCPAGSEKELSADPQNNVIFIDKEKRAWKDIKTDSDLNDYIDAGIDSTKTNYILIDEVQEIKDFENSLRDYRTEEGIEIVVTGSNAETLSSDLSTKLGGRHHEVYVQSLCYLDFLRFHSLTDSDESLQKYIEVGGLPGLRLHDIDDADDVRTYCEDVLNTALIKDIILKHKIRNVSFLYNLVRFLADNTGKLISATSISKYMRGREESVSTDLR